MSSMGRGVSINALVTMIDAARGGNLSSALRLFVRQCYRDGELPASEPATQAADAGADAAGPVTPLRIS